MYYLDVLCFSSLSENIEFQKMILSHLFENGKGFLKLKEVDQLKYVYPMFPTLPTFLLSTFTKKPNIFWMDFGKNHS